jgi:hypothetical protein
METERTGIAGSAIGERFMLLPNPVFRIAWKREGFTFRTESIIKCDKLSEISA